MRLGLASLLVALSSILATLLFRLTLAVTPPTDEDDFSVNAYHHRQHLQLEQHANDRGLYLNDTSFDDSMDSYEDDVNNTIDGAYGYKEKPKEKPTARDLKTEPATFQKKKLTVGYLTAVRGDLIGRQGLQISGAITMALKQVIFSISSK